MILRIGVTRKMQNSMPLPYLRENGPTTEYRPTPHFGLNFPLRPKVYSNMRPYVAAPEHACAITVEWVRLRSLSVHNRSFEAETWHKTN